MIYLAAIALVVFIITAYFACRYFNAKSYAAESEREKWEAEAADTHWKTLRSVVYDGCAYAFEQAAKARKSGMVLSGEDKRNIAVDYVLRMLPDCELLTSEILSIVDSCLAKCGDGASGRDKI
jgi:hypothetical protein